MSKRCERKLSGEDIDELLEEDPEKLEITEEGEIVRKRSQKKPLGKLNEHTFYAFQS